MNTNTDGIFLWFGDQPGRWKVTMGGGERGIHYTVVIKEEKKAVDIHKTFEKKNGTKRYEKLFEMKFYTILRCLALYKKAELPLLSQFWFQQKINAGKLRRHNLILMPMLEDKNIAGQFLDLKHPKKIRIRKVIPVEAIKSLFKFPEEIVDSNEAAYWVISVKNGNARNQGLIFRNPLNRSSRRYFFISNRNFGRYSRLSAIALYNSLCQVKFVGKDKLLKWMFARLEINAPKSKAA